MEGYRVDPLGVTYLRIRGMWGIESPGRVFGYLQPTGSEDGFAMNALILKSKYEQYPEEDRANLESLAGDSLKIKNVDIKNPNNPANLLAAVFISFKGGKK